MLFAAGCPCSSYSPWQVGTGGGLALTSTWLLWDFSVFLCGKSGKAKGLLPLHSPRTGTGGFGAGREVVVMPGMQTLR